jgi:tRNA dimethylallyltransferase
MLSKPSHTIPEREGGQKTCLVIVGPTAVGKTALAVQLAQHFSTEIISCDSRQCFKELDIGVAKPAAEELDAIVHHFINSHSIHDAVNAASFEKYALEKISGIFSDHDVAVMVGGTGLYVKAFCEGIDEVPEVDEATRQHISSHYNSMGMEWLTEQVQEHDPLYFSKGEIQNPQRMMRALEVKLCTGRSILDFQTNQKKARPFNIVKIGLELPRPQLIDRINTRVQQMMEQGLLEEVRSLLPYEQLNALQTVGYREIFAHFHDECSLEQAVESIKINTRQYAKRQMTWFKKDAEIKWIAPDFEQLLQIVNNQFT